MFWGGDTAKNTPSEKNRRVGLNSKFGGKSGVSLDGDIIKRHSDTPQTRPTSEGDEFGAIFRAFLLWLRQNGNIK